MHESKKYMKFRLKEVCMLKFSKNIKSSNLYGFIIFQKICMHEARRHNKNLCMKIEKVWIQFGQQSTHITFKLCNQAKEHVSNSSKSNQHYTQTKTVVVFDSFQLFSHKIIPCNCQYNFNQFAILIQSTWFLKKIWQIHASTVLADFGKHHVSCMFHTFNHLGF